MLKTGIYLPPPLLSALPKEGHAIIEASAGTGKTYTIEHIVVDQVLAGLPIESILVVTFTEKATSELKARIRALLEAVLMSPPGVAEEGSAWLIDAEARERLKEALFRFEHAAIYTIHGLCHRVLSELAFESGQLFSQELVNNQRIFHRVWRQTLRTQFATQSPFKALLTEWLEQDRDEKQLEQLLFDAHRQRYLEHSYDVAAELPELMTRFATEFSAVGILKDYRACAIQKKSLMAVEEALAAISEWLRAPGSLEERLSAFSQLNLQALLKPRRTRVSKRTKRFPDELQRSSRRFLERIRQLLIHQALLNTLERRVLEAFLPALSANLELSKRRDALLDYDDLLELVWRSLESAQGEDLSETLRQRFRLALIDEFQDTDDRQWSIFRRIFLEGDEEGRLYVIGDPKQAIYGFRGADLDTYLKARARLLKVGAQRLPLKTNFRSSAAMLRALNLILDQQGKEALFSGSVRYDEPVECGLPSLELKEADGSPASPVVLMRYRPKPGRSPKLSTWSLRRAFGEQLSACLSALLGPEEKRPRWKGAPIRAQDIFILVRDQYDAHEIAQHLRVARVPYSFYKQDGLFQTQQAREIADVLRALSDPHNRGRRLKALATPFFGLRLDALLDYKSLTGTHPLLERLFAWHQLAEQERYPTLFHRMLHESGLVERELFYSEDERALGNHQHILEQLLEISTSQRSSLPELLERLERYIQKAESPPGQDGNIQRRSDERDAVQIMTIHKSKGLEAPVVCLYGGFRQSKGGQIRVIHEAGERRVLVGNAVHEAAKEQLLQEQREEDERLLYVALTRSAARLYLPFAESSRQIPGPYGILNRRLYALFKGEALTEEFLLERGVEAQRPSQRFRAQSDWCPPPALLQTPPQELPFEQLRWRHAALKISSYTRMKEEEERNLSRRHDPRPLEADEFKEDGSTVEELEVQLLPGGPRMGRFFHEVLEELSFESLSKRPTLRRWSQHPEVRRCFEAVARRHSVEEHWLPLSAALIYNTLTKPLSLGARPGPPLYRCRHLKEMEFLYPIPEQDHPRLGLSNPQGPWRVERGFIKGFIDLLFEYEGRVYFLDWKSDLLPSYRAPALKAHIEAHYELQAQLYTLGVLRWLRIYDQPSYEARFGGLLYLFLRGRLSGEGLHFERPSWESVQLWERGLRDRRFGGGG